jgi:uncharacterized protein (TIGR03790 family)
MAAELSLARFISLFGRGAHMYRHRHSFAARVWVGPVAAAIVLSAAVPAIAQTADNVVVVINEASEASQKVGEYYARKRSIASSHVIRIRTSTDEAVERAVYTATIEQPVGAALARGGLQDRVLYVVLTKGIPLQIKATGSGADGASVDSELTMLYRRLTGAAVPVDGRIDNPYFLGDQSPEAVTPFSHRRFDIYLVTRLDAFTVDDVLALIDRGSSPSRDGHIVLDQQDRLVSRAGEDWLAAAAKRLITQGHGSRVVLETTPKGARGISPVLGYYSWGSSDPRNRVRTVDMDFVPGSLAAAFVGSGARTFREPPVDWAPTDRTDRAAFFADSSQSLIGDLIREGATGVAGYVAEPQFPGFVRPQILFPVYLAGANLAEAFYAAIPDLSWQAVIIGDPLCAPFRTRSLTRSQIDDGIDAVSLLPKLFLERRLKIVAHASQVADMKAVALALRGDVLLARGQRTAARQAFEEATRLAPQFSSAQLQLAMLLDQSGNIDAAIERYRRVLALQRQNALAMNNLAYRLAVDRKSPAEALPLAKRAVELVPTDPSFLDTLAWVQHLLGDRAAAAKTMSAALKYSPADGDVRLRAAVIYAASGARAVAEDQLAAALRLKPSLEGSADVKRLKQQLDRLATER